MIVLVGFDRALNVSLLICILNPKDTFRLSSTDSSSFLVAKLQVISFPEQKLRRAVLFYVIGILSSSLGGKHKSSQQDYIIRRQRNVGLKTCIVKNVLNYHVEDPNSPSILRSQV